MKINKYNAEGYADPTAYEALMNLEQEEKAKFRYRPVVYICSPYSGDTETNTERARRYCRFAVTEGCIPLAPHLFFPQFMDDGDRQERDLALFMDLVLLSKCAELWVFGTQFSPGMNREIAKAKRKGMTIRYFTIACEEVSK